MHGSFHISERKKKKKKKMRKKSKKNQKKIKKKNQKKKSNKEKSCSFLLVFQKNNKQKQQTKIIKYILKDRSQIGTIVQIHGDKRTADGSRALEGAKEEVDVVDGGGGRAGLGVEAEGVGGIQLLGHLAQPRPGHQRRVEGSRDRLGVLGNRHQTLSQQLSHPSKHIL